MERFIRVLSLRKLVDKENKMKNIEKEIKGLVEFIRKEVNDAGKKGCVVGVSGGIDSAVIACLCKKAFPKTTFGVSMPKSCLDLKDKFNDSFKGNSSLRAVELCKNKKIPLIQSPIQPAIFLKQEDDFQVWCEPKTDKAVGNSYARMRMIVLYYIAEMKNCLVIGTDNLSENFLGYFSKGGDGMCDLNPLGEYFKSEVYALGKALGVPKSTLKAKPSAELWEGQTDEGEMGFTYNDVEKVIRCLIEAKKTQPSKYLNVFISDKTKISEDIVDNILKMNRITEHKRIMPKEYHRSSSNIS